MVLTLFFEETNTGSIKWHGNEGSQWSGWENSQCLRTCLGASVVT